MFYVGIDIAKKFHVVAAINQQGKLISKPFTFNNSKDGFENLLSFFNELALTKENCIIGMESTSHYWLALYSALIEEGFETKVFNPIQSDAFRNMYVRQTKTDKVDAFIIAQVMRFGQYSTTVLADEITMALRQLSRYRLALVDEVADCKRRVICVLDQVFPEYCNFFSDIFGATSKELLLKCQTPEDLLEISTAKLTTLLKKSSHGHFGVSKAKELKLIAKGSFGISFAKDAFSFQLKQLIEQIIFLENQINALEKEISTLLKQTDTFITTIPGIGETLGAVIIGEIGDVNRFDAPNKLVAFAGLDVKVTQSGEFLGNQNKMSKRGSPYLRRAIWLAASRAAFCDPILSAYYQSLMARGKHHFTAIGAVSRKLTNIIFTILKERRAYLQTPPKVPNFNK